MMGLASSEYFILVRELDLQRKIKKKDAFKYSLSSSVSGIVLCPRGTSVSPKLYKGRGIVCTVAEFWTWEGEKRTEAVGGASLARVSWVWNIVR